MFSSDERIHDPSLLKNDLSPSSLFSTNKSLPPNVRHERDNLESDLAAKIRPTSEGMLRPAHARSLDFKNDQAG